ncbi:MAG: Autotransporter-associated beta strand repeat protein [Verrucomicrobiales bacterium]|nr:Autotransporter-associated beta strand repeat protein [Verrucomicrobiales bacterium]
MKTNNQLAASSPELFPTPSPSRRFPWLWQRGLVLILAVMGLSLVTAPAATLTWDANTNNAPSDGSGLWHVNPWWNGTSDQAWADGNIAIVGATNVVGSYSINLDGPVSAATVAFKTNGYTLTGSTLTFTTLVLSNGVTAVINCPLSTAGGTISLGNGGASLTLGGGYASTSGNPTFKGANQTTCSLNITNGNYTENGTFTGDNITINQSGGGLAFSVFNIGRNGPATYNLSGGSIRNTAVGGLSISRGFAAVMNVSGNGLIGSLGNIPIAGITAGDNGTLNVSGGTINVGTGTNGTPGVSSALVSNITMLALSAVGTYTAASKAILNISGGTVTAKGILVGSSVASYVNNPACQINMTGGLLYLDANGIAIANGVTGLNTLAVNLSGGTIAATANWTASVPMNLTATNGDLNVRAADVNGVAHNITFASGLSGPGGLIKTGGGILTLSGANSYAGTTTVSNGQLTVSTAAATSIGPVRLNSGTILSTVLAAKGQSWINAGVVVTNGVTLDFNFGGFQLSPSVSAMRVNGDLTLDSSDNFTIEGSALLVGTYPLITCTGTLTLTGGASLPTITSLPSGVVATLAQNGNTINLVISSSPNIFISWGALAAGSWDFTTTDWLSSANGSATNYTDGIALNFDDNANSAVAITLNTNVQPGNVTANNNTTGTASYTITGTGAITGNTSVLLQGSGTLALATSNSYSGGTIVNSGTLGINNGGDGSGPSAIGTGPLTLNPGATIDNTSGSNVTLKTLIQEYWNGNFTYAGSQTNLDLGNGPVTLGRSVVGVTVLSNTLTCGGAITDNGLNYQLAVQGPGALTLKGTNTYAGGTTLNSGKLNINSGGDGGANSAIGTGTFAINGGTIDNTSGSDVQITTAVPEAWNANFTFAGTGNLDLGSGTISVAALTMTLQNGATLKTEGAMNAVGAGGVATMTLAGNGTFKTSSNKNNGGLSVAVNGGLYLMDKASSASVHSVQGLTVNTGGTARITGTGGKQIINSSLGPVTLSGGTLDLFGSSESIYLMNFNSGILQNSSTNPSTLTMTTNIALKSAACNFDVVTNSALTIPSLISGTGALIKIGAGTLKLGGTNAYTGSTTVSNGLLAVTTATTANRNYIVVGGELEAVLDPTGVKLQMTMSNLTFGPGVRLGFDLASGSFSNTTSALISTDVLAMNGNVAVDIINAPTDTNNDMLFSYTSRNGAGVFVAGNVPAGAFIYDNTASRTVSLTYTQPPPPAPTFTSIESIQTGGVISGITFSGVHGPAGGSFQILSSTNVALQPLSAWTVVQSGNFDGSGSFNVTIGVVPGAPQTFYLLSVP